MKNLLTCSVALSLSLATTCNSQLQWAGNVFLGGVEAAANTNRDFAGPTTAIRPSLTLAASSTAAGARSSAGLTANVDATGIRASAHVQGPQHSRVQGLIAFSVRSSRTVRGRLVIQLTSNTAGSGFRLNAAGRLLGPTPARYTVPITLSPGPFGAVTIYVQPWMSGTILTTNRRTASLDIRFEEDCTVTPYGRSCASLTGEYQAGFSRVCLDFQSDARNAPVMVLLGTERRDLPTAIPACRLLLQPMPSMIRHRSIVLRTDAHGKARHYLTVPSRRPYHMLVQFTTQRTRTSELRTSNGIEIRCR